MKRKLSYTLLSMLIILIIVAGCSSGSNTETNSTNSTNTPNTSTNDTNESASTTPEETTVDFPTKEIKLIVPYSPGGGFDTSARLIAPFMEKYLPNDVKIVVENKPGGEGNIGLGEVYNADPDGYTMGIVNFPGNVVKQVLGEATFDVTKFQYIGRVTDTVYVAAASKKSNITTFEEFRNAGEIVAGITNISSTDGLGIFLSAEAFQVPIKMIPHDGSTEAILAAIRGDVDWVQYPLQSIRASVVDSKELIPLWIYAEERHPDLPDTPTIVELGFEGLLDTVSAHRVLVTTPNVPEEIMNILRDSFNKAIADPEFAQRAIDAKSDGETGDHVLSRKIAESSLEQLLPYKEKLAPN